MSESSILLVSRHIDLFDLICGPSFNNCNKMPQHMFILHKNSEGKYKVYRGGPKKGSREMTGDLEIIKGAVYEKNGIDWVNNWKNRLVIKKIDSGSDEYIASKIKKMDAFIDGVNNGNFDYKLPTEHGYEQNSNAVARRLIEEMGYEFRLPIYDHWREGEKPIWAPGWDSEIFHTKVDEAIRDFNDNRIKSSKTEMYEYYKSVKKANAGFIKYTKESIEKAEKRAEGSFINKEYYMKNASNAECHLKVKEIENKYNEIYKNKVNEIISDCDNLRQEAEEQGKSIYNNIDYHKVKFNHIRELWYTQINCVKFHDMRERHLKIREELKKSMNGEIEAQNIKCEDEFEKNFSQHKEEKLSGVRSAEAFFNMFSNQNDDLDVLAQIHDEL